MPPWWSRETLLYWLARALVPIGLALWLALLLRPAPTPEPPSAPTARTVMQTASCVMDGTYDLTTLPRGSVWVVASAVEPGHCGLMIGHPRDGVVVGLPLDSRMTAGDPAQILVPVTTSTGQQVYPWDGGRRNE